MHGLLATEAWAGPIAAALVGILGVLVGAYLNDRTRSVVKAQLAETLRGELALFKEQFLKDINGTYQRTAVCKVLDETTHKRIDINHADLRLLREELHSRLFGLETLAMAKEKGG
ncbi:MAG TPA: hypothetical protein VLH56_18935 [Dissulfurispiraceae bacterium]|nr:hypothetical protein [Dissulfurispiraceae bacterium]